jgi:transcriptional regulator with XRE-family HTH domain
MNTPSQAWLSGWVKHGFPCITDAVGMSTIGERIQEAMTAARLDQPGLARRIGVSKQAISAMISGSTKAPTADNVFRIAEATGFEPKWIVTGKGPRTKQEAAMERLDISMLSPAQQAAIRAALRAFAEQENHPNGGDKAGSNRG